jgi:tetratricopeptide (TPR) repeat protein
MRSLPLTPLLIFLIFLLFLLVLSLSPSLAAATKDQWIEVRSPHFTVVSNAGEKQARRIADQFEQIRNVFQTAFPKLRADLGKPILIFALKNEESMRALLPAYWEVKHHVHPAGLYIPGEDKHCVVVRADFPGDNPYEVVYHEYAHALENLNFQELPLWLSEGVAEFLGNSRIHDSYVEIGASAPQHFHILRENKLIPIDVLLEVDHSSPFYNEENRTSLFYAESWALVHFLLMDPEARQKQLLQNFLSAYQATGSQVEAAEESFGDLAKFARVLELYAHQGPVFVGNVKTSVRGDPKSYASRALASAEIDALRGDLYTRTRRPNEAKAALDAALQEDPKLPLVHEALGMFALSQHDTEQAESEFSSAVQLNSSSFLASYFSARSRMRNNMNAAEATQQVIADLEKAISLNPQFAPGYEALSSVYSLHPETVDKAVAAGKKAIQLEPGTLSYAVSYGYVLLRIGKGADAKVLAGRIQGVATTPQDQSAARQLAEVVASREAYDAQMAAQAQHRLDSADAPLAPAANPAKSATAVSSPEGPPINNHAGEDEFAVEGTIFSAECPAGSTAKVTITLNKGTMAFRIPDLGALQVLLKNDDVSADPPPCTTWKGRRARLFFYKLKEKEYKGELSTIQFF